MSREDLINAGISPNERAEAMAKLDKQIAFLNGAGPIDDNFFAPQPQLSDQPTIGPAPRIEFVEPGVVDQKNWEVRVEDAKRDAKERLAVTLAQLSGATNFKDLNAKALAVESAFNILGSLQTIYRPLTSPEPTFEQSQNELFEHGFLQDENLERDRNRGGIDAARQGQDRRRSSLWESGELDPPDFLP
jgi:hypothetical protein